MFTTTMRFGLMLGLALILMACDEEENKKSSTGGGSSPPDTVMVGGLAVTANGSTATVDGRYYLTDYPQATAVQADDSAGGTSVYIQLDNPPGPGQQPATYPLEAQVSADGRGTVEIASAAFICSSTGGTITVTAYGAVGGMIAGTIDVDGWNAVMGACPSAPTSGSFSVTRRADDRWMHAVGTADTFTGSRGTPTTNFPATIGLTENETTPYDPVMSLVYNTVFDRTAIYAYTQPDATFRGWARVFTIDIPGSPAAAGAPIALAGSPSPTQATFQENLLTAPLTTALCTATAGTVQFTGGGAVGGLIAGNISVTTVTGDASCPASYSVNFTVTRDGDEGG